MPKLLSTQMLLVEDLSIPSMQQIGISGGLNLHSVDTSFFIEDLMQCSKKALFASLLEFSYCVYRDVD
jgi:hypothetical protein